jgi:hypothetical protein
LAIAHWWLANVGLAALVTGFMLSPHLGARSAPATATGSALFALGAVTFVYNLLKTFNAADARQRARAAPRQAARSLPTVGVGESLT